MKNWAGNIEFHPSHVVVPQSEDELKKFLKIATAENKTIRVQGSGHSWTGLIATDDYVLNLDKLQGLISVDQKNGIVKAHAGTKLHHLTNEAFKHGLALINQGDINKQSLAGACSTGTHGTGITLQSMSNQVQALTLMTPQGDVIKISESENSEFFQAARVSLGSMGIILDMSLKLVPQYKLKVNTFPEPLDESILNLKTRLEKNRHLEMFYFPVGNWCLTKTMNMTEEESTKTGLLQKFNDVVMENWLYELLNITAKKTHSYELLDKLMRGFVSNNEKINWSHLAFPTERSVKFMEMEYNIPFEHFDAVLDEIKTAIKKNNFQTLFPIEIRFVKGDEIWLSPAYKRDSVYFAIHSYISEEYRPYFIAIEKIFLKYSGRPHWGKWNSLDHTDLSKAYPKWLDFVEQRKKLDPKRTLINPYLNKIFPN